MVEKTEKGLLALFALIVFALGLFFAPGAAQAAQGDPELEIRGIGQVYTDQVSGTGVFYGLAGLNVTSNEANAEPIEGVTIKVYEQLYDDEGYAIRNPSYYAGETPIASTVTTAPFDFDNPGLEDPIPIDFIRNFKIELDAFKNKDRDVLIVASKDGYESVGSMGFLTPLYRGTVKFESNGGSAVADIEDAVPNQLIAEPTPPTYDGFVFKGWHKDEGLTDPWDFSADTVTKPVTILYAKWEKEAEPVVPGEPNEPKPLPEPDPLPLDEKALPKVGDTAAAPQLFALGIVALGAAGLAAFRAREIR